MQDFVNPREKLKSGISSTGETGTVMCNLPHGLDVILRDAKGEPTDRVVFNGANHRRAIDTDTTLAGRWGSTHNVSKGFWDRFAKTNHPAVANGNIFFSPKREQAEDAAEEMKDAIATGTNQLDPDKPGRGIEPMTKAEDDD